jgi:hypothetical protein
VALNILLDIAAGITDKQHFIYTYIACCHLYLGNSDKVESSLHKAPPSDLKDRYLDAVYLYLF